MRPDFSFIFTTLIFIVFGAQPLSAQSAYYEKLSKLYSKGKYEKCLALCASTNAKEYSLDVANLYRLKTLYRLRRSLDFFESKEAWRLDLLKVIQESREKSSSKRIEKSRTSLYAKIQRKVFEEAKMKFESGERKEAEELFDALFATFPDSIGRYKNLYPFPDTYAFVEEMPTLYNNPKYRMAETMFNASCLSHNEKTFLLALNIMRFDAKLFIKTILRPEGGYTSNLSKKGSYAKFFESLPELAMLKVSCKASDGAACHSESMYVERFFSHDRHPNWSCPKAGAENCAMASYYLTPFYALSQWYYSEPHMRNMMNTWRYAGYGIFPEEKVAGKSCYATLILRMGS